MDPDERRDVEELPAETLENDVPLQESPPQKGKKKRRKKEKVKESDLETSQDLSLNGAMKLSKRMHSNATASFISTMNLVGQSQRDIDKRLKDENSVKLKTRTIAATFIDKSHYMRVTVIFIIAQLFYLYIATEFCIGFQTQTMYHLSTALHNVFGYHPFETISGKMISFKEINSISDIWDYLERVYMPNVYPCQNKDQQRNGSSNNFCENRIDGMDVQRLLGAMRLGQLRMPNDSCEIWEPVKKYKQTCIANYDLRNVDKEPYGPDDSTAWRYRTEAETKNLDTDGTLYPYEGGGYYIDINKQELATEDRYATLMNLKNNLWIDRFTRAVILQAGFFNANTNLFVNVKILFEIPATGAVISSKRITSLMIAADHANIIQRKNVYKVIYILFNILAVFFGVRDCVYFRTFRFKNKWVYIDLIVLMGTAALLYQDVIILRDVRHMIELIKTEPNRFVPNLESILHNKEIFNRILVLSVFLIYVRTFEYMNFSKTMMQMNETLNNCYIDICMFFILFGVLFGAFASAGCLLFGSNVYEFCNVGYALFSLLRVIFGDLNYNHVISFSTVMGPIYFVLYIIFVIFTFMNLLLSILNDTYSDVTNDLTRHPDEFQTKDYVKHLLDRCLRSLGSKIAAKIDDKNMFHLEQWEKIKEALKQCGFNDLEIEMFFARYNIDPTAEVGNYDKTALKKIMEEDDDFLVTQSRSSSGDTHTYTVGRAEFNEEGEHLAETERILEILHNRVNTLIKDLKEGSRDIEEM